MNKRTIIIIVVLSLIALGIGAYFAWQQTRVVLNPPSGNQQNLTGGQSITPDNSNAGGSQIASKLKIVSDKEVYAYWVFSQNSPAATSTNASSSAQSAQTSGVFYLGRDGLIYKVNADGADSALTSNPIENFQSFEPSFDGKRVIFKYGDLNSPKFVIYNTETGLFESLPANITSMSFSPDAKKIAYLASNAKDASKSDLSTKSLVDSKQKPVILSTILQSGLSTEWVSSNKIIFSSSPSAFYSASIWSFDISKKTFSLLIDKKQGLDINWSSDGKIGFMFSSSLEGRNRVLNLITDAGEIRASFDLTTLPEKCFVSDPKIYCAVPQSVSEKAALPDDYLKNAVYFVDSIYQIDIAQNSFDLIFDGSGNAIDAFKPDLKAGQLFFINKYDNRLYALEIQ